MANKRRNQTRKLGMRGGVRDVDGPVPVIEAAPSPWNAAKTVTIRFLNGVGGAPEIVVGFVMTDITVINCTLSNFTEVSSGIYEVTANPTGAGLVTVSIDAGVCTDMAGNPNLAPDTLTRVSYAGINLWLDVSAPGVLFQDSAGTIPATLDGDVVGRFVDARGVIYLRQNTTANKPQLKLAVQNGLSVLRFDGSDDFLSGTFASIGAINSNRTIFMVYVDRCTGGAKFLFDLRSEPSNGHGNVSASLLKTYYLSAITPEYWGTGLATPAVCAIDMQSYSITNGRAYRRNAGASVTNSALSGNGNLITILNMGGLVAGGSPANFDLAEMLVFADLTEVQQNAIFAYLNSKWAVY